MATPVDGLTTFLGIDDASEFLGQSYTKAFKRFQGPVRRFGNLFERERLPELFESKHLKAEQVTCMRAGERLGGAAISWKSIEPLLEDRGVVTIAGAETLDRTLWDTCRALSRSLREKTIANVYAGAPSSKGFDNHIDHHDVFVAQLSGKKRWWIYAPTCKAPLLLPDHMTDEPGKLLWSGVLEPGDVLYFPRGFWHRAEALDNVSTLHVSFGVQPCTGVHFLAWIRKQLLLDSDEFRAEIPRFTGTRDQQNHSELLGQILNSGWDGTTMNTFLKTHEQRIESEMNALERQLWS